VLQIKILEVLKMFKVNLKNYIAIAVLTVVLLFGVVHFEDIAWTLTVLFRL
jgi:hypothetical protein